MTTMVRPGPVSIDAGQCRDGLVIHIYSVPDARLLRVSPIDLPSVERRAIIDRLLTDDTWVGPVCLVCYDGDSGERCGVDFWSAAGIKSSPITGEMLP